MTNTNKKAHNVIKFFAVTLALVTMLLGLTACSATYSADSVNNNLTRAGYNVTTYEELHFTDDTKATDLSGLQKIYYVTKGSGENKEAAVILVFDSIANANKLSDRQLFDIMDTAKANCGSNKKSIL